MLSHKVAAKSLTAYIPARMFSIVSDSCCLSAKRRRGRGGKGESGKERREGGWGRGFQPSGGGRDSGEYVVGTCKVCMWQVCVARGIQREREKVGTWPRSSLSLTQSEGSQCMSMLKRGGSLATVGWREI